MSEFRNDAHWLCQVNYDRRGQEIARLREALKEFGAHAWGCAVSVTDICDCGLEAALRTPAPKEDASDE